MKNIINKFINKLRNSKFFNYINNNNIFKLVGYVFIGLLLWYIPKYLSYNFDFFDLDGIRSLSVIFVIIFSFSILNSEKKTIPFIAIAIIWIFIIFYPYSTNYPSNYPILKISSTNRYLSIEVANEESFKNIIDIGILHGLSANTSLEEMDDRFGVPSLMDLVEAEMKFGKELPQFIYFTPFGRVSQEGGERIDADMFIVIYPDNTNIFFSILNKQVTEILKSNPKINIIYLSAWSKNSKKVITIKFKEGLISSIALL